MKTIKSDIERGTIHNPEMAKAMNKIFEEINEEDAKYVAFLEAKRVEAQKIVSNASLKSYREAGVRGREVKQLTVEGVYGTMFNLDHEQVTKNKTSGFVSILGIDSSNERDWTHAHTAESEPRY